VVGIGAELNGDDAAGVMVARRLRPLVSDLEDVLVLEGGSVPESIIGPLRRFSANLVVLVDAADFSVEPGSIRWIDQDQIGGSTFSTHSVPLSVLCQFMEHEIGCEVQILGIQPESIDFDKALSVPCKRAVNQIVKEFKQLLCVNDRGLNTQLVPDESAS